jgi:thiol:disulfide interchange protein DsbD
MQALLVLLVAWFAALTPPAPGSSGQQNKAKAEFFARADGSAVRAAIRIKIQPGWHLYGEELGNDNAIGLPTKLDFSGDAVHWGAPRFPKPEKADQPFGKDGNPTWIYEHHGTIVIYVAGELAKDAKLDGAELKITGLTCEDAGSCVPYEQTPELETPGPDSVFANFPSDLKSASAPAAPVAAPVAAAPDDKFEVFEDPKASAKVELFTRAEGSEVRAVLRIAIKNGWHLYHETLGPADAVGLPTEVALGGAGIAWGSVVWPEPVKLDQPVGLENKPTWIFGHKGTITLYASGKLDAGVDAARANVSITGLTCEDAGKCVQFKARVKSSGAGPNDLFAKFPATNASGTAVASSAGANNTPPSKGPAAPEQSLAAFLALAVFWGVFSLLMPCTYPMIPITISFFTKQAAQNPGKQLRMSALYGLGIVAMFILIGVLIGAPIIQFATHPVTNLVIGAFFVLFGLSLFGVVDLQPPSFLMNMAGQARMTGGYLGVFFMGATLVITSFTCTAPFVGSLLSVGASSGNLGRIVVGMGTFGLTMAIPFVALAMIPGKLSAMPRSGEWMHTLKVTLGFVELAAAMKFISNADIVYSWGILPREVFLVLWCGIFIVAALFLMGIVRMEGESGQIGPGRLVAATAMLLLALYCGFGALGNQLDVVMTAIAPPYSSQRVAGFEGAGASVAAKEHEIVKDDLDAAIALASQQGKLVLVNFTGYT